MFVKNNIVKLYILGFLLLLTYGNLFSQSSICYLRMQDGSGINTDQYQAGLNTKACQLRDSFPNENQRPDFKVFDFGFYLLHDVTQGLPAVFQSQKQEIALTSPYYLLFGKQNDKNGIYSKIWVDVHLPNNGYFECMDNISPDYREAFRLKLELIANKALAENGGSYVGYAAAEKQTMDSLMAYFGEVKQCCIPSSPNRSGGCGECMFSATQLKETIRSTLETSPYQLHENHIQEINCGFSITYGDPIVSEYLVGATNLNLTINSVSVDDTIQINLDEYALCKVQQQHDDSKSAKAFVLNARASCFDFTQQLNAFIADDSYAKFLFCFVPETGTGGTIISCSVIGENVANVVNYYEGCEGPTKAAIMVFYDQANYYYAAKRDQNGQIIPPINTFTPDGVSKLKTVVTAPYDTTKILSGTDIVWVNPETQIRLAYMGVEGNIWKFFQRMNQTITIKKPDNSIVQYAVGDSSIISNIYARCGDGENTLTYRFTSSTNTPYKATIKLLKTPAQPLFICAYYNNSIHNLFYYGKNLGEDNKVEIEKAIKARYKLNSNYTFYLYQHNPETHYAKAVVLENGYGSVAARTKTQVTTLFLNHENKALVSGGTSEQPDCTSDFFNIKWRTISDSIYSNPILPDEKINEVPINGAFAFNASVTPKTALSLSAPVLSTVLNILDGENGLTTEFEVAVKKQETENFISKKNYLGNNKRYKSSALAGGDQQCEHPFAPGDIVQISSFNPNGGSTAKVDWELPPGVITISDDLTNVNNIIIRIPDISGSLMFLVKKNSNLIGTLSIKVKAADVVAPYTTPQLTEIKNLKFTQDPYLLYAKTPVTTSDSTKFVNWYNQILNDIKEPQKSYLVPPAGEAGAMVSVPVIINMASDSFIIDDHQKSVGGYTVAGVDFSLSTNDLKIRDIIYEGNVVKDATLVVPILATEKNCIFDVTFPEIPNEISQNYLNKLSLSDTLDHFDAAAKNLITAASNSHIKPTATDELKLRRVNQSEVAKFMTINKPATIIINADDVLGQDAAARKGVFQLYVRHELAHAIYPAIQPYQKLKWHAIRVEFPKMNLTGKILADFRPENNMGGQSNNCSAGPGHEKHNPEHLFSCEGVSH